MSSDTTIAWARGVSLALMLVLSGSDADAQGTISYSSPQQPIGYDPVNNRAYDLDINGDGTADYSLQVGFGQTVLQPYANNSFIVVPATPPDIGSFVAALDYGQTIDTSPSSLNPRYVWFDTNTDPLGYSLIAAMNTSGHLGNFFGGIHYVGLYFEYGGASHYGWIRIDSPSPNVAFGQILDWAYDTRPGASIFAGAVPEPSSFAVFGIGAIALLWMQRHTSKISNSV